MLILYLSQAVFMKAIYPLRAFIFFLFIILVKNNAVPESVLLRSTPEAQGISSEDKEDFVHKGIAKRAFKKQLQLSEYVECRGAKHEDGMLKVELKYDPPENKKPKKITIK